MVSLLKGEHRKDGTEARPAKESLRRYLSEISQLPLLSPEEEAGLARKLEEGRRAIRELSKRVGLEEDVIARAIRAKLGGLPGMEPVIARLKALPREEKRLLLIAQEGEAARLKLIEANLRLVVYVAKRWRGVGGLELGDLISAGNEGLIRAVDGFDWKRGNRFSTYALWWIELAIRRAITSESRLVRLPAHMEENLRKVRRAQKALEEELSREPTLEEIAKRLGPGWTAKRVGGVLEYGQDPLSLDQPVGEEEEDLLGDFIPSDLPSPVEHAERKVLEERVEALLSALPEREATVLRLRYGLDGAGPHTLEETGEVLGLSREGVRWVERKALHEAKCRGSGLRGFLEG